MADRLIGAVEAGGTKFVVALAREDGMILARERIPTAHPDVTLPAVRQFFEQSAAAYGRIDAFGIASFGPLDLDPRSTGYGAFTTTPKPGWRDVRYHDALASFGVPVGLDTDVNGAAIGEWLEGAGRDCRTVAYTTVGTGIGTGVVQDGWPLGGISHYEAGHILVPHDREKDPFPGICAYHGDCVEGLAAGPAIAKRFGASLDKLGPAEVELVAEYLSYLASTLVLLHMPDRLIFGGGVMKTPGLIGALRLATEQRLAGYIEHPRLDAGLATYITTPQLGDDSGIRGAIQLGRNALAQLL